MPNGARPPRPRREDIVAALRQQGISDAELPELVADVEFEWETHERRRRFGEPPGLVERIGLPGVARFGKSMLDFLREAGETAAAGYRAVPALSRELMEPGAGITELQETEERGEALAKGLATFPYEAVKQTRAVTQRALAGEDVSPSDIAEAWAGGAMGVAVPAGLARGGVRALRRARGAAPREPARIVPPAPEAPAPTAPTAGALTPADAVAAELSSRYPGFAKMAPEHQLQIASRIAENRRAMAPEPGAQAVEPAAPVEPPPTGQVFARPPAAPAIAEADAAYARGLADDQLGPAIRYTQQLRNRAKRPETQATHDQRLAALRAETARRAGVQPEALEGTPLGEPSPIVGRIEPQPEIRRTLSGEPILPGEALGPTEVEAIAGYSTKALEAEAARLSLDAPQSERLRVISQEVQRRAAEELPAPARTAEEAAPQIPEALPRAIVERERRRVQQPLPGGVERRATEPPRAAGEAALTDLERVLSEKRVREAEELGAKRQNRNPYLPDTPEHAAFERGWARAPEEPLPADPGFDRPLSELATPELKELLAVDRILARKAKKPTTVTRWNARVAAEEAELARRGERGALRIPDPLQRPTAADRARMSPELRAVSDQIAVGELARAGPPPTRGLWSRLRGQVNYWLDWIEQRQANTARAQQRVERLLEKAGIKLRPTERPWLWANIALKTRIRSAQWIYKDGLGGSHWTPQGNIQPTGTPPFERIMEPLKGDPVKLRHLDALLVSEHAPFWEAMGRRTGLPPAAIRQRVIDTAPPDVRAAVDQARQLMREAGQELVDATGMTQQLWNTLQEMYPNWVSFERAFEGEGARPGGPRGGTAMAPRAPIRRATKAGGTAKIISPIETIPDKLQRFIRSADLHRAARSFVDLLDRPDVRAVVGDMVRRIEGGPPTAPMGAAQLLGEMLSDRALRIEGDRLRLLNAKTGALETWALDPFVADALRGLTPAEFNFAAGFLTELFVGVPKGLATAGVTRLNPIFGIVVNTIRDAWGRPTMSRATRYPFERTPGALFEVERTLHGGKPSARFQRFRAAGGGFGISQESSGILRRLAEQLPGRFRLRAEQKRRQRVAARMSSKVTLGQIAELPIRLLEEMSVPPEQAGRYAEFKTIQDRIQLSDLESVVLSDEALANFSMRGSSPLAQFLGRTLPFFNPGLQGLRAFRDAVRQRPGRVALMGFLTITVPTLLNYFRNLDDDEIQQHRQAPGSNFYIYVRQGPDRVRKIPKPFLPGYIFGTAVERGLDELFQKDRHAFRRAYRDLLREIALTGGPPALNIALGMASKRDPMTGIPIVPSEQQELLPEFQIGRHPSPSFRRLTAAIPGQQSPAMTQFVTGQLFGTAGREYPRLLDVLAFAEELPETRREDRPFVGRFEARYPSTTVGPIRDVYEESRRPVETLNTLRYLARKGQSKELLEFIGKHKDELAQGAFAERATRSLSALAEAAERLEQQQALPRAQRAALRDRLVQAMIQLAEQLHEPLHNVAPQR